MILSSCRYFLNFDFHYFTGVTALTHTLFTPHFSENVTLLRSFHTFGPEIALNPHGLFFFFFRVCWAGLYFHQPPGPARGWHLSGRSLDLLFAPYEMEFLVPLSEARLDRGRFPLPKQLRRVFLSPSSIEHVYNVLDVITFGEKSKGQLILLPNSERQNWLN